LCLEGLTNCKCKTVTLCNCVWSDWRAVNARNQNPGLCKYNCLASLWN